MNWYYKIRSGHTHVRVFMNGAKCGDLVFRNEEFEDIRLGMDQVEGRATVPNKRLSEFVPLITFFNESE